jgi:hypothetical protein
MPEKSSYFHQIECIASAVIPRAMIVWTAEVCGRMGTAFHTVQALRSIIPQAKPTHTGYFTVYIELKRSGWCEVVRLQGLIRCYSCAVSATFSGRSARVKPISHINDLSYQLCTFCEVWGVGLRCGKTTAKRRVLGLKTRRFVMV